jgi:hypothetical protein
VAAVVRRFFSSSVGLFSLLRDTRFVCTKDGFPLSASRSMHLRIDTPDPASVTKQETTFITGLVNAFPTG